MTIARRKPGLVAALALGLTLPLAAAEAKAAPASGKVSGDLKKWHKVTITFDGPATGENAAGNPFRDYRLDVTFTRAGKKHVVCGYWAADGDAGNTSADKGNKWRVHFAPDAEGQWQYRAGFRAGPDVALADKHDAGKPAAFDGASGSFRVGPAGKPTRDHRTKGMLRYVGRHYLQFAQTREFYLKGGADSPENFLGYYEFDQTPATHKYLPHAKDFRPGDPTWGKAKAKGKNIIGALNYLASRGMNSVYFLTMNVKGDGKDVWPWTSRNERFRFDCSKLDQWEVVFCHMDKVGIVLHVLTQETENDQLLDGGDLGPQRKLYYRELIARFAHHPAVVWNLGEENTNTDAQRKAFTRYIRRLDPYNHPIVVHTFPGKYDRVYRPLLGLKDFEGPSLQMGDMRKTHDETKKWIDESIRAGRRWVVFLDEIGPAKVGVKPDDADPNHDDVRRYALWGNLMAGGAGCEWYFGYRYAHNDLNCEDWRSRRYMWDQTRFALEFFQKHLPFDQMRHNDELTSARDDYCLAKPGRVYAIYLPRGGTTALHLGKVKDDFDVQWYSPRSGGALRFGNVRGVRGPGAVRIGNPPAGRAGLDWVALITRRDKRLTDPPLPEAAGRTVDDVGSRSATPPPRAPKSTATPAGTVTGFTLINADTNQPVAGFDPIAHGAKINLAKLPTRKLNIRANTKPAEVGSIRFVLAGRGGRVEGDAPYSMAGDDKGNYKPWTPRPGAYRLTAKPYSQANARGKAGKSLTITFWIIDKP